MRLGLGETARPATRLRALIAAQRPLVVPGCYNALSARILEHAGLPAVYMSGYGTSLALLGLPDAGLSTLTEMALNAKLIAAAVRVPVIADADTGFGNAINVIRTVEEYIRAGVAGLHLEDQVAPKRCGHVAGREVIGREEAAAKIRAAACGARRARPRFRADRPHRCPRRAWRLARRGDRPRQPVPRGRRRHGLRRGAGGQGRDRRGLPRGEGPGLLQP